MATPARALCPVRDCKGSFDPAKYSKCFKCATATMKKCCMCKAPISNIKFDTCRKCSIEAESEQPAQNDKTIFVWSCRMKNTTNAIQSIIQLFARGADEKDAKEYLLSKLKNPSDIKGAYIREQRQSLDVSCSGSSFTELVKNTSKVSFNWQEEPGSRVPGYGITCIDNCSANCLVDMVTKMTPTIGKNEKLSKYSWGFIAKTLEF